MVPHPLLSGWTGQAAALMDGDAPEGHPAVALLRAALPALGIERGWRIALDVVLLRVARRIDAVLVTDRAVLAILVRPGATAFRASDRLAAEDAALDLADFHEASRGLPVIPVLVVPNGVRPRQDRILPLAGAAPVLETTRLLLPALLHEVAETFPPCDVDPAGWTAGAYRPVPALLEAACLLYARHGVTALRLAQAGHGGLARTGAAIHAAIGSASGTRLVVFVTGAPGAGKTLCGLDLAFQGRAAFLTGNPSLVHVLRDALVRDAVARGMDRRAARRRVGGVVQALPAFRDQHLSDPGPPPERLVVIDEAQRCWSARYAVRKTQNMAVALTQSEPAHLLDIMARHSGGCVLVCLLGGGQEIHEGEGGLAAWGEALATRPDWRVAAPPGAQAHPDPRQRLPPLPHVTWDDGLHLADPVRAIHAPRAVAWVEAVLADDAVRAAEIVRHGGAPFQVTRSLRAMRQALRPGGTRSCGLLASSGARRLRAEGLGATVPHQDEDAVARWFLDRWPDIRSGDALEVVATEFAVQGLELDRAGLCWDGDLVRAPGGGWQARAFRATAWTLPARAEALSNRLNAYRVLLTRARHGTVIWVPRGEARDPTRDPAVYDAVAAFLLACGAVPLDEAAPAAETVSMTVPSLL